MNVEYMIDVWGGAWNDDANPSIEADLGIKSGPHYFNTSIGLDRFIKLLKTPRYYNQGIVWRIEEGELTHTRTVMICTFRYANKYFVTEYDFGYDYPEDVAENYFTSGNYSCDCNRSSHIRAYCGNDSVPELGCGCEIELVSYTFEHRE